MTRLRVPPVRLLDDPSSSAEERALLEAGATPVDYDVSAGLARLRAATVALAATTAVHGSSATASAATHTAATGASATTGLIGKASLKLLASIVGAGVAVGSVVALQTKAPSAGASATLTAPAVRISRPDEPSVDEPSVEQRPSEQDRVESPVAPSARRTRPGLAVHKPVRTLTAKAVEPTPVYLAQEEERTLEPATPAPLAPPAPVAAKPPEPAPRREPPEAQSVERPEQRTAPEPEPPAPPAPSVAVSEMQAIARARGLLASDPAAALATLEKLRREHPNGFFVEERRALTVLALARAGNRAAAREQGAAFLKRYPNGPFTDRVRAVVR